MLVQYQDILRVGLPEHVEEIAKQGYNAEEDVDDDVEDHVKLLAKRKTCIDPATLQEDSGSHEQADEVAHTGDPAECRLYTELEGTEAEPEIVVIGQAARVLEYFGVVYWDIGGYVALDGDLLHPSGRWAAALDDLVLGILHVQSVDKPELCSRREYSHRRHAPSSSGLCW